MFLPAYFLNWALSLMVVYSLTTQASALDTPSRIMRKRPVPFASEPTAPGLPRRQGYGSDSPSPTTASINSYTNLGCWRDTTTRILPGSSTSGTDIDVESCQDFCSQNSYSIFGVEARSHCYCGNTIDNNPASASSDDCSATCAGNPQEICCENWRINIYSLAPTTASFPGYSNLGCWSDTSVRILPGSSTAGADMVIESCQDLIMSCSQSSFTIFGVEARSHCYCGNTLDNNPASASSEDCSATCAGNPQEICCENWRINIYSSTKSASSSTASPTVTPGSSGLSQSDKVAIGVGLGIGLPMLIIAIFSYLKQPGTIRPW